MSFDDLYTAACSVLAGGVNSPSRSYKSVGGGAPVYMSRAEGAYLWDLDHRRYIDYLAAYGPIVLGHGHPAITKAIIETTTSTGVLFGTPHPLEITFAHLLREAIPSMERIRFTNSGTEAVMSTIRLARAATGRTKIVKFSGCYHGHTDAMLVAAGSGAATCGVADSAGVTAAVAQEIITVPYNDADALADALSRWHNDIAAVLIEPVVGNFGIVAPEEHFLEQLCSWTRAIGALVIYDEVISAFRFHWGGFQTFLPHPDRIVPDLTALGKIIGGGLPIGAYGGRADIMALVAPDGPMYQAGTHAGNPLSLSAGFACVQQLQCTDFYTHMDTLASVLTAGLRTQAEQADIPITIQRIGGAFSIHFCDHPIRNVADAGQVDTRRFALFFHALLQRGVLIAPSIYEAWFVSVAHTMADIEETLSVTADLWRHL